MSHYLITGASGGLGSSIAAALTARGDTITTLSRHGADFGLAAAVTSCASTTTMHGRPFDGMIHCAGAEVVAPLRLTSDEQYRTAMIAASSAFALLRAAAKRGVMVDGGSIVLMSSVAAHRGTPGMTAYSAGKAAIEAMVRCAAVELAPRRLRVNAVAAGAFTSPMHERIVRGMPNVDAVIAYKAKHPLGFGSVDAVRDAVLHLLSDAARWTTGSTLVVDGGLLAA
jgi:NAD(P)-dependent dehydrogenase (short-subunit alcohol dehydrogenase family)